MELIDIVDEQGNKTGEIITKPEVHKRGLWHQTVHIWIINSRGEILMQHRSEKMENYPGMGDISVAGHISSGEDSKQGALREIKEEIGIDLSASDLQLLATIKQASVLNNKTYFDNEFSDVYLVKLDLDLDQLHLQEEEVAGLRWVPIKEFKKWVKDQKEDLVPHTEEHKFLLTVI